MVQRHKSRRITVIIFLFYPTQDIGYSKENIVCDLIKLENTHTCTDVHIYMYTHPYIQYVISINTTQNRNMYFDTCCQSCFGKLDVSVGS